MVERVDQIETTMTKPLKRIQKECEEPNSDQEGIYFLALALKEVNTIKNTKGHPGEGSQERCTTSNT